MLLQGADGRQAVYGVPGETADGLGDDQIDLPGQRIRHHAFEALALFRVGAGDAFVYIDSGYDTNTKRHLRCKSAGNDVKWGFLRNMLVFWWEAGKAFHRQYLNNV